MIPGLGRSSGEGKGYPLQYSGLENSMDCIVHGVTKGQTQLSDFCFSLSQVALKNPPIGKEPIGKEPTNAGDVRDVDSIPGSGR